VTTCQAYVVLRRCDDHGNHTYVVLGLESNAAPSTNLDGWCTIAWLTPDQVALLELCVLSTMVTWLGEGDGIEPGSKDVEVSYAFVTCEM